MFLYCAENVWLSYVIIVYIILTFVVVVLSFTTWKDYIYYAIITLLFIEMFAKLYKLYKNSYNFSKIKIGRPKPILERVWNKISAINAFEKFKQSKSDTSQPAENPLDFDTLQVQEQTRSPGPSVSSASRLSESSTFE